MSLPDALRKEVESLLPGTITGIKRLSGGDINAAALIETADGPFFIKWNDRAPADMFEKEAKGLELLRNATESLDVPKVIHWSPPGKTTPSWLLMEFLKSGPENRQILARFGESLAVLHSTQNNSFGLDHDNYIGRLHQSNTLTGDWPGFFISERIEPQLRLALDSGLLGHNSRKDWKSITNRLSEIFPESRPSLLHGDLWSGNWFCSERGCVALIDPAVYFGHPEMEIAFTQLFGRFPEPFYNAYETVRPLEPGFGDRAQLYNLYPLLVHTNLFGGHYAGSVDKILRRFS